MEARRRALAPVGRDEELARIDGFLSRGDAGGGALVLEGEAGIGKTTLWLAGLEWARARGFRVLAARPAEAERELSFATLGDLLADLHGLIEALPAAQRRPLACALLLEEARGLPVEPRSVAVGLLALLRVAASEQPVLIAVDDVQWVDAPSAAALSFALRRTAGERIAILLSHRTGSETRVQLDPSLGSERVVAGPLSLGAVRELLSDRLGLRFARPIVRRIHERAGGNPFFALELARALAARGGRISPLEELPVPHDLERLVAERLRVLPAETKESLAAVAALGEPTLDLVDARVLEPAFACGVLVLDGERIRFEHPLLAAAAYSALTPRRRRALHRRLAERVDDAEERARHLALAVEPPDSTVAAALEDAARRAFERGATESAAELIEHALRITPPAAAEALNDRRLVAVGYLARIGAKARACEVLDEARSVAPAGPDCARVALTATWFGLVDAASCIEMLRGAVVDAGDDLLLLVKLHSALAPMLLYSLDLAGAEHHAARALELAEEIGDTRHLVLGLVAVAHTGLRAGRPIDFESIERAVALEDAAGNPYGNVGVAHGLLGMARATTGDLDAARRIFEAKAAEERRRGDVGVAWSLSELARVEIRAGNWDRAQELAEESIEVARDASDVTQEALAHRRLVALAVLRGEEDRARRLAAEGLRLAELGESPLTRIEILSLLGLLELSLDDVAAAASRFDDIARVLTAVGFGGPDLLSFVPDQIEALVATGELDDAEAATAAFETHAERLDRKTTRAAAARCRGHVLAARGDVAAAVEKMADARALAVELGQPFELARTLLAQGEALRRFKQKRAAREALEAAVAVFDELGAKLWGARARRELARISGRARAGGLTETERRVAELVAVGRANKEIASELFVTVRTVETHLTKIYAKLGVHSRTELVSRQSSWVSTISSARPEA